MESIAIDGNGHPVIFYSESLDSELFSTVIEDHEAASVLDNVQSAGLTGLVYHDNRTREVYYLCHQNHPDRRPTLRGSTSDFNLINCGNRKYRRYLVAQYVSDITVSSTDVLVCIQGNSQSLYPDVLARPINLQSLPPMTDKTYSTSPAYYGNGMIFYGGGVYEIGYQGQSDYQQIGQAPNSIAEEPFSVSNDYLLCYNQPMNQRSLPQSSQYTLQQEYSRLGVIQITQNFLRTKDDIVLRRRTLQPISYQPTTEEESITYIHEPKTGSGLLIMRDAYSIQVYTDSAGVIYTLQLEGGVTAMANELAF